jgi:alginate O-acetyltransferase complex protein AlgI
MLFNSFYFFIFLLIVFLLYWSSKSLKYRTFILFASSYFFYAQWDYRFLFLIFVSSLVDFLCGYMMSEKNKKLLLAFSLIINLGLLAIFKYYNFFVDSFKTVFSIPETFQGIEIILPIGISFYTFQSLSYTIDVYKKNIQPCKDPLVFFTFVSFFPQLVAGPIERAKNLIKQFKTHKEFNYEQAMAGFNLIIWGLFKKIVIADNLAHAVNNVFEKYNEMSSLSLLAALFLFAIQIYCDFSGYSDMARGIAKLFGIELMINFKTPYFARDLGEFWRRWHISLSTWFRDYIFIPLGGSVLNKTRTALNILIVFLISGLWHGANTKFIFWGFIHALFFLPLIISGHHSHYKDKNLFNNYKIKDFLKMLCTFFIVCFAWLPFRADSMEQCLSIIERIFNKSFFSLECYGTEFLIIALSFLLFEWFSKNDQYPLEKSSNKLLKNLYYFVLISLMMNYGYQTQEFIYFQF